VRRTAALFLVLLSSAAGCAAHKKAPAFEDVDAVVITLRHCRGPSCIDGETRRVRAILGVAAFVVPDFERCGGATPPYTRGMPTVIPGIPVARALELLRHNPLVTRVVAERYRTILRCPNPSPP
jgi:hypothetical protein